MIDKKETVVISACGLYAYSVECCYEDYLDNCLTIPIKIVWDKPLTEDDIYGIAKKVLKDKGVKYDFYLENLKGVEDPQPLKYL